MNKEKLPRFAFHFLQWFCPDHLHEEIEGDLIQKFNRDVKTYGERKAKMRFVWNAIRFFRPGILLRNRFSELNTGYVILTNLRFTMRHLLRQKINSSLHVIGLTMGMSVCLLIGLFIHYELSFDSYHNKPDRIYRVNSIFTEAGTKFNLYATPIPMADAIRNEVSAIEKVTLTRAQFKTVVEINPQKLFKQERTLIVEPEFLDIFKVEVLRGDGYKTLKAPYQALLTETVAEKFFGKEDPIGKTFLYKNKFTITVGGVIRDMPANTNLPAAMLLSYVDNQEFLDNGDTWFFGDFPWTKLSASTYVVLAENYSPNDLELQLQKLANKNINSAPTLDKQIRADFEAQPLMDIHFDTQSFGGGPWVTTISRSWLWFFAGLGIIVLTLACINFLNLSTAQAFTRAKEVGVRKSIGAQRGQLIVQFLGEAFILVVTAGVVSIGIANISLGHINDMLNKSITFQPLQSPELIATLSLGILLTALLAGLYPAWIIARFNPVTMLKSNSGGKGMGASWLRKGLVVIQFTVSAGLFIVVLLIAQQVKYVRGKDIGFEKDNIVNVEVSDARKTQGFVHELRQIPGVKDISLSRSSPISNDHWWNTISQTENGDRQSVCAIHADDRFYAVYGLRLLSGRIPAESEYISDSLQDDQYISKVVVNEKLLKALALGSAGEAVGKLFWWGRETEIVGVVADFNIEPLKYGISSMLITQDPSVYTQANIKIARGFDLSTVLAAIEVVWKRNYPDGVYEVSFLDNQIDAFYNAEDKLYFLFKIFSVLAISISCLGLWGLVTFATQQRTKEIGIRKVLGASVNAILFLLSKDFLSIIIIAFVLASPLSYYFMSDWLGNFAYRIDIGWQVFAITGLTLLMITILTVSFQTWRAALANPVKSLKSE